MYRIGVVGNSQGEIDEYKTALILYKNLDDRSREHLGKLQVVSGYTDMGVPGVAYRVATELNIGTVGIACKKAKDYECFPCEEVHIIGEEWGGVGRRVKFFPLKH